MAKFDDAATNKIEGLTYTLGNIILFVICLWGSINLVYNQCKLLKQKHSKTNARSLSKVAFYIPLVYYVLTLLCCILGTTYNFSFNSTYIDIFAVIFPITRLILIFNMVTRLYFSFNQTVYKLTTINMVILLVLFILSVILFIAYFIGFIVFTGNNNIIDDWVFLCVIIAFILDSILVIIICYLFISRLWMVVSNMNSNHNMPTFSSSTKLSSRTATTSVFSISYADSSNIELSTRQIKYINMITKQTILSIFASLTILVYTITRLVSYYTQILRQSPYIIIIMALLHNIFVITSTLTIYLAFIFNKKQYYCLCKLCHKCMYYCCQNIVKRKVVKRINDFNYVEL